MAWNKNVKTDAFSNSIIASIARLSLVASSLVFIFVACGGDSGSSAKPADDAREVATVVDMGRCTNEREGDTVYVAEKMADYLCKNRTWVDLSTISHSETKHSSSSVAKGTLSAASGNSSAVQGTSSATPGSHTSTSSSSVVAPNSVSGTSAGKDENPNQEFIRENISVTGVAQKGPFKFGSPLNLYELKKDLSPSGRVYNDEINSNKGDFVIPKVSLASPYAKLEVAGLYRNEVTGEWSKEPMTLFALTDFSDKRAQTNSDERVQVNINLLTHLEYDRALYLVQEKGYSVYAAKKQAAQEIMTAFEFATAVTYSEDFAIFQNDGVGSGTIAGNGTLLAISALVMGNRSDAEIQTVIDKFREDIKTDGEWNDLQTKANMADWARDFKYNTIRAAVKSWNILDIPDYETYLDVYWNNVYGLGGCSEIRKGTVAPNSNKLSKYYKEYFVCKVDGSKYSWAPATTMEKDTYEWAAGKSGEFKKGNVTDTIYTYNGSKWEVAARETTIGVCESKNAGVVSKFNGTYYICKSNAWGTATVLEYDTYGWKAGTEGAVKAGDVNTDKYYVYENGAWRASSGAIENSLGACVTSRDGEVGESGKTYYICKSKTWTTATVLEYDTYGWKAGTEGSVKAGSVNTDKYYVYENGAWRASSGAIENSLGACVTSREGVVGKSGSSYYICKSKTWKTATTLEYDTYGWNAGTEGEVKAGNVNTGNYYIYKNGKWQTATGVEGDLGGCTTDREGEVSKSGSSYYICKSKSWTTATALEYDTYGWEAGTEGEIKVGSVNTDKYYIYKNGEWQIATSIETDLGGCTTGREGEVDKSGSSYYICKSKSWKTATALEYDTYGWIAGADGEVKAGSVNTSKYYIYKSDKWQVATALEYDTYGWKAGTEGDVKVGSVNASNYYVYKNGKWQTATSVEKNLGGCTTNREGEVGESGGSYYICKSKVWNTATVLEYDTYGKICSSDGAIVVGNVSSNKYVCNAGVFRKAKNIEIALSKGCVSYTEGIEVRKILSAVHDSVYSCNNGLWNAALEITGPLTDSRDNKTYKVVAIGKQIWMAENLNYKTSNSFCARDNCSVYGRLYAFADANIACPSGWHLPSTGEWDTLFDAVGGRSYAGNALKSQSGWYENRNGSDKVGFCVLPSLETSNAIFWTSGCYITGKNGTCYYVHFYDSHEYVSNFFGALVADEDSKYSVRCLLN